MGARLVQTFKTVGSYTLCQLEERFASCVPPTLFPKAAAQANSRDRIYTRPRTFWSMLWQCFNPKASGREVVRQLQALFELQGGPSLSEEDGAYCRAKARLPLSEFPKALPGHRPSRRPAGAAPDAAPGPAGQGRRWLHPHRPRHPQKPQSLSARPVPPNPISPCCACVVLFSLLSGAILAWPAAICAPPNCPCSTRCSANWPAGDILMGDRGFGNFVLLALSGHSKPGVDFIGRSARRVDGRRRLKRLGPNDWLVLWKKGTNPSPWLPQSSTGAALPKEITVRIVRRQLLVKGFRVRQVTLVTTLLDPQRYPAAGNPASLPAALAPGDVSGRPQDHAADGNAARPLPRDAPERDLCASDRPQPDPLHHGASGGRAYASRWSGSVSKALWMRCASSPRP